MKKLSLEALQEKYAMKSLSVDEMEQVNGGCADFSDVRSGVSSTDCIMTADNPFRC